MVKEFKLYGSNKKNIILSNKKLFIGKSKFEIDRENKVRFFSNLSFENSNLKIIGYVDGNNYKFMSKNAYVDLESLKPYI